MERIRGSPITVPQRLDLTFLGSGNAFGAEGRAFSSFILNGCYLFDCGPTILQQLKRARIPSRDIDTVFISHFHGDHFFGLPFLYLDLWHSGDASGGPRIRVVGPPGIEQRAEHLLELAFPSLPAKPFDREYIEVHDGMEAQAGDLAFTAASVDHVPDLECFAYRVHQDGRSLVFSGDTHMCDGLLRLVPGADVLVLECSCDAVPVHLSTADVAEIARHAPGAQTIVTHHDITARPEELRGCLIATDLSRFSL